MKYIHEVTEKLKKLEKFSSYVIGFGFRLSIGLIVLSALLFYLMGKFGDYMTVFSYARAALDTAPAVFVSAVAAGLISDIVIKERMQNT